MSLITTLNEIEYPESDGKPMGETDLHRLWMIRLYDLLSYHYRGQQVYLGSDLLVYYVEGSPREFVVPDVFVVQDCKPGPRRVFKTWEEGTAPHVVFEVTSRSTRHVDQAFKPQSYARIGVREYFLYDPTSDYLAPPLQGFRMAGGNYASIEPEASGALECRQLGLTLRLEQGQLILSDLPTGRPLDTEAEAERAAREVADARTQAERSARQAAEARIHAAEARAEAAEEELRRLKEQMQRPHDS